MTRIALIAVLAAASASAQTVVSPVPAATMQPGYGVVQSVTPVRVVSGRTSAAAGGSSAAARPAYRVTVLMADGSLQARDLDRPEFRPGDEVLLTNSGDVVAETDSRGAGDADRGSTPPGTSHDDARPAEGAIQGGSIAPGESGGTPQKDVGKGAAAGSSAKREQRCYELGGSLREQCLADEALGKKGAEPAAPGTGSGRPSD